MTQRDLAASAGISQSQVAEIETGSKTGSIDTLRKLAAALKVQLDSIAPASPRVVQASATIQAAATVTVQTTVQSHGKVEAGPKPGGKAMGPEE